MNNKNVSTVYISFYTMTIILLTLSFTFPERAFSSEAPINEASSSAPNHKTKKKLAYVVSDVRIPFWDIMARGIKKRANSLGYELTTYGAENSTKKEIESIVSALKDNVSGIIVSPTSSSACVTILKLAKKAGIPVVISDIGTDSGEYVSFISSNNKEGAYQIGKILAKKMHALGLDKGSVGIVAIPQKRLNGQLRTAGFMQAMDEAGIKGANLKQQSNFSYKETYLFAKEMIEKQPNLRALFIQGSDRYKAALDAISDTGNTDKVLLVSFDAEPIFIDLISKGVLVGSAMQQPYLMGEKSVQSMHDYLQGNKVEKNQQLSILAISAENIAAKLSIINRNVLGIESK